MIGRGTRSQSLTAVTIAAAIVVAVGFVVASLWLGIGDSEISTAGWLALGLGVVLTLGLGIGLMALVLISNRRGYDEVGRPGDRL
jgi:hypothetical protein